MRTSCEYAPDEEVERQADLARQLAGGEIPFPRREKRPRMRFRRRN